MCIYNQALPSCDLCEVIELFPPTTHVAAMAAGSFSNPIMIDCDEGPDEPAGRQPPHHPAFDASILRERPKTIVYYIPNLFRPSKYGICRQRKVQDTPPRQRSPMTQHSPPRHHPSTTKHSPARQRSPPGLTKVRRGRISIQSTPFKEVGQNTMSKKLRQKLSQPPKSAERTRCNCSENDRCAESCHNRRMSYACDKDICGIGELCTNRLATKPQPPCSVLQAGGRGLGLFADKPIRQDQVVAQYTGEVITMNQVQKRYEARYRDRKVSLRPRRLAESEADMSHAKMHYIMHMEGDLACDATSIGSKARFVNHHCDPNCVVQKWTVSRLPCLFIFALRDVQAGEELTIDYRFDSFSGAKNQPCLCGAACCRGFIDL